MSTITQSVEYRTCEQFPGYRFGSDGTIWSCWAFRGAGFAGKPVRYQSQSWKALKPDRRRVDGRARYTLRRCDGVYKRAYASHFILSAFGKPRPYGLEACHEDGNCLNDSIANLRWDTSAANKADMKRHGTMRCGESHPKAKLGDGDIAEIIVHRQAGRTLRSIGDEYGVTEQRIHQITRKGSR